MKGGYVLFCLKLLIYRYYHSQFVHDNVQQHLASLHDEEMNPNEFYKEKMNENF
jgi:hypothetical protein